MYLHFPGVERYARCPGSPADPDTALCSLSGSAPPPPRVSAHGVRLRKFRVGQEWFHGVGSQFGCGNIVSMSGFNVSVIIASVLPHWVGNGAWEPFTGMTLSVH
jgi:hypothetical protein